MKCPQTILPADPHATYLAHRHEIDQALLRVLDSGWYVLGAEVSAFESEFARYVGVSDCIGVANGTDAIVLALRCCGVGPGDAVVTVSHTAVATVAAIDLVGATPILVDIDPATFTMDPQRLLDTLTSHRGQPIRAVIPVHLYGHPAGIDAISDIATRFGIYVIEDCAQSHGASWEGRVTGSFGDFGTFSFYPTKNLGTFGDGGACVTRDARLAERARELRQYGWKQRYTSESRGMNTRLDELHAAILRVKLPHLTRDNERRRQIAAAYVRAFQTLGWQLPTESSGAQHVYHQFTLLCPRRDRLQEHLRKHGVGSAVLYPVPVHCQPAYRETVLLGAGGLPHTEQVCRELLCIPVHPQLDDSQVNAVMRAVLAFEENDGN